MQWEGDFIFPLHSNCTTSGSKYFALRRLKLGLLSKDDARKLCRFFAVVGRGANLQVPLNVVSYTTGLRANQRCFDSGDTSTAEERHL